MISNFEKIKKRKPRDDNYTKASKKSHRDNTARNMKRTSFEQE